MTISDSFTSEHVGFVPVGICFGSPETFPVEPAWGNVALSWKHLSPALPVSVLHSVSVEEEPGKVIFHVDAHCLAAFDEGIVECRNLRSGLGDAEKEGLSSTTKGLILSPVPDAFLTFTNPDGESSSEQGNEGIAVRTSSDAGVTSEYLEP